MRALVLSVLMLVAWVLSTTLTWWWGCIILPAVGLTAPLWSTWLWAYIPIIIGGVVAGIFKEILKEAL